MMTITHGVQPEQPSHAPCVPEGTHVYVIGDIHGRSDLLAQLHDQIEDDARQRIATRKVLVYIGDYIDRSEGARQVLDTLTLSPLQGFEHVYLKGNHEDMFLRFMDAGGLGGPWMMNGGVATMRSYGVNPEDIATGTSVGDEARSRILEIVPEAHLNFLRNLALVHIEGDYLFVHAGLRPGVDFERQDPTDLVWIRDEFLQTEEIFPWMIVHGHSVHPCPDIRANRIGIDTGAYRSDTLTCLVLDGTERRFIQT